MSEKKRYKIINDTIKPVKLDAGGRDIRTMKERVGHAVLFAKDDKLVTLYQNRAIILNDLSDEVIGLHKRGLVSVQVISDIADELKNFAQKPVVEKEPELKGKASLSGEPVKEEKLSNPDGEPNFTAKPIKPKKVEPKQEMVPASEG